MKRKLSTILGLVMALGLVGTVLAADATTGTMSTDVFVMGLKSSGTTAVVADYIPAAGGAADASRSVNITDYGGYEFKIGDSGLSDPWEGSMVVSADAEVAAVAEVMFSGGSASDSYRIGYYNGFSAPAATLFLPYAVWARPGTDTTQFSMFTIQNTGNTSTDVDITYIDRNGTSYGPYATTVPGNGTKTLDMSDSSDPAMPDWTSTTYWTTTPGDGNWTGGVIIESDPHEIAAALVNVWPEYAATYSALPSGGEKIYLTNVERKLYEAASASTGKWEGLTSIIVQNFDLGSSANFTVTFVSKATGLTRSFNDTLVAGGAHGYNTRAGQDAPGGKSYFEDLSYWDDTATATNTTLGDWTDGYAIWVGSAYIEGEPGTNLAAAVFNVKVRQSTAAMYASVSDAEASTMVAIPTAWRRRNTATDRWNLLRVMNVGGATATDIDFKFYNQDGTLAMQYLNQSAAQYQIVDGMNLRTSTFESALGDTWNGTVVVTSDEPIVATSDLLWSAARYGAFNGYPMAAP